MIEICVTEIITETAFFLVCYLAYRVESLLRDNKFNYSALGGIYVLLGNLDLGTLVLIASIWIRFCLVAIFPFFTK